MATNGGDTQVNNKTFEVLEAYGQEVGAAIVRGLIEGVRRELAEFSPLFKLSADIAAVEKDYYAGFAADVTETITEPDEDEERPGGKTHLDDCLICWCNSCANIERCKKDTRTLADYDKNPRPFPCANCTDGMRYMPMTEAHDEKPPCSGFERGSANYV